MATKVMYLCPGQGAQAVGMGKAWIEASPAARQTFQQADAILGESLSAPLSELCFNGPAQRLNATDVSQPAIYTCSVACHRGLMERDAELAATELAGAAGLSLGEYTALHLAGAFDFEQGLRLVALRGRLMQEAAERSRGSMLAIIGADEAQAQQVCEAAADGEVLVPANFNAPGQIVLSGHATACERAAQVAADMGLRATPLTVAGAFHSPLMAPAAEQMAAALADATFNPLRAPVWSNVTAEPHPADDAELLKRRLVEQITSPVRWAQTCERLVDAGTMALHELAPGTVLRGLMRRIDRSAKVNAHDAPE